jgi:hypothetical protein
VHRGELPKPPSVVIPERDEDRRRAAIRTSPLRVVHGDPSGLTKIKRGGMNRMALALLQQMRNHSISVRACKSAGASAVLRQAANPSGHHLAIERGVSHTLPVTPGEGCRRLRRD